MFEITLNGHTLYHPNSLDCTVTRAVIHEALNDAGYMDITIPFTNPMSDIQERKGKIIVYKDNVPIWYGEVHDISLDFSKNTTIYAVGEASYLNDTVQPQIQYTDETKYQIFTQILNRHNAMVDSDKEFLPGAIGNNANARMTVVTNYQYTLDAIRELLCEANEYVRIRHIGGKRYIDIMPLDSYGKHSNQPILFGDNLLDYTESSNGREIATVCIPLGMRLDESKIEGYDNYLTCESANGGKNYVELLGAISRLGRITRVVHFDDIDNPTNLVSEAIKWLQTAQYSKLTLNLSAVDLSVLHTDIDNYAVGDFVRAICEPLNMDAWFPIRERETDLLNLANNKIALGIDGTKAITTQQIESISTLEKKMPNKDAILQAALRNASALINANGTGGYVSIRTDKDNKPYEIIIMDDKDIVQATRGWRWNLNGFGHGTKAAGDPDFTWETNVAITMDGSIVANYITSGTLTGIEINNGNKTFHVDSAGNLNASNATISGSISGSSISGTSIKGGTIKGTAITGGSINGATFHQEGGLGTIDINNGWIYGTSGRGDGAAMELQGKNGSALYGSYWMHAQGDGMYMEVPTIYVCLAGNDKKSDKRLKEHIKAVDAEKSIQFINNLNPYSYNYKKDKKHVRYGFIAQEVNENLKECGLENNGMVINGGQYLGLNYQDFIPHLINYVRDLQEQINKLKGEKT